MGDEFVRVGDGRREGGGKGQKVVKWRKGFGCTAEFGSGWVREWEIFIFFIIFVDLLWHYLILYFSAFCTKGSKCFKFG